MWSVGFWGIYRAIPIIVVIQCHPLNSHIQPPSTRPGNPIPSGPPKAPTIRSITIEEGTSKMQFVLCSTSDCTKVSNWLHPGKTVPRRATHCSLAVPLQSTTFRIQMGIYVDWTHRCLKWLNDRRQLVWEVLATRTLLIVLAMQTTTTTWISRNIFCLRPPLRITTLVIIRTAAVPFGQWQSGEHRPTACSKIYLYCSESLAWRNLKKLRDGK